MLSKAKESINGTYCLCLGDGGGLGHLTRAQSLIPSLREQGHDVSLIVRELSGDTQILGQQFPLYQSPIWKPSPPNKSAPISYAELLLARGFDIPDQLLGMIKAWQDLFKLLSPDLIIFDHAPTALLASRTITCKRVTIGHGFFIPPCLNPIPSFSPWGIIDTKRIIASENKAVAACNQALTSFETHHIQRLCDLFDVDAEFLTTWLKLDHYTDRKNGQFLGVPQSANTGIPPEWPNSADGGKRIFTYLKNDYAGLEELLSALAASPHAVLIYMHQPPARWLEKQATTRVRFATAPIDIKQTCTEADLIICHDGIGTVSTALMAEKPVFVLPQQLEQFLMAKCVERLGAELILHSKEIHSHFRERLEKLLSMDNYRQAAAKFRIKYRDSQKNYLNILTSKITQLTET